MSPPLNWDSATRMAFRGLRKPQPATVPIRPAIINEVIDRIEDDSQLLAAATNDAVQQLAHTRSKAAFFRVLHTSETTAAEIAEKRWRDRNPGLAHLVDRTKGGA